MRWKIEGADEHTGTNVIIEIQADNHQDALAVARARGILTSSICQKDEISASNISNESTQSYSTVNPSLYIGIAAVLGCILPIVGIPISIAGLIIGIRGPKSASVSSSIIGIALNSGTLIIGIISSIEGARQGSRF